MVIRSLIWKKKNEETMEHADFIIDPDGILTMILNEAVAYELKQHRPTHAQMLNKEILLIIRQLLFKLTKLNKVDLW